MIPRYLSQFPGPESLLMLLRSCVAVKQAFRSLNIVNFRFMHSDNMEGSNKDLERNGTQRVRFPYGISNFEQIRLDSSYFYVDNTSIIRELENAPSHVIINRPARWGKSLLLSMLQSFYCFSLTKENFRRLFNGLDIESSPTASRGSYFVLKIDMSSDADSSRSLREVRDIQLRVLFNSIKRFSIRYGLDAPLRSDVPDIMAGLDFVASKVLEKKGRLLILVDEYDRLANKFMFENPDVYSKVVLRDANKDPLSSPILGFFESIKAISAFVECRSIVTGITPIALTDSSGGNIWANVSLNSNFGNYFGFCERDIRRALALGGLKATDLEFPLQLMVKFYNGHRFPGSTCSYLNPTLCLYFLHNYFEDRSWRWMLEDKASSNQSLIEQMYDENVHVGDNVLALLCQSKSTSAVVSQLLNNDNPLIVPYIHRSMRLRELTDNSNSSKQQFWISSFMFYHGIASIRFDGAPDKAPLKLQVPNQLVRLRFLARLKADIKLHESDVIACFSKPDAESVQRLLQRIVDRQDTLKDNFFGDAALQSEIKSALNTVTDYVDGLQVTAERNVVDGRYNLLINVGSSPPVLLELKRIRPNALDYEPLLANAKIFFPRAAKWYSTQLDMARDLLGKASADDLRCLRIVLPHLNKGAKRVIDVENGAEFQCADYLRRLGPGTAGFTVVQVGWTLLVKAVSPDGSHVSESEREDK